MVAGGRRRPSSWLLQSVLLVCLLRQQPELPASPTADLVLGDSWAHVVAPHAHIHPVIEYPNKRAELTDWRWLVTEPGGGERYARHWTTDVIAYQVSDELAASESHHQRSPSLDLWQMIEADLATVPAESAVATNTEPDEPPSPMSPPVHSPLNAVELALNGSLPANLTLSSVSLPPRDPTLTVNVSSTGLNSRQLGVDSDLLAVNLSAAVLMWSPADEDSADSFPTYVVDRSPFAELDQTKTLRVLSPRADPVSCTDGTEPSTSYSQREVSEPDNEADGATELTERFAELDDLTDDGFGSDGVMSPGDAGAHLQDSTRLESIDSDSPESPDSARFDSAEADSEAAESLEAEAAEAEALLDDMIRTYQTDAAAPVQGRLPLVRTMSMEQRWQDLASLLALPAHESHAHHQHALAQAAAHHHHQQQQHQQQQQQLQHHHQLHQPPPSAAAQQFTGFAAYGGSGPEMSRALLLPPPPPGHGLPASSAAAAADTVPAGYPAHGSVTHVGSAVVSAMQLTDASSATGGEPVYYSAGAAAAVAGAATGAPPAPAGADGGLLSQILGVDELPLMELPLSDGHPEWTAAPEDPYTAAAGASDYAKVSPRLCEYPGYRAVPPPAPQGAASPHESRTPPGLAGAGAVPSMAAPKKHQLFGRRYFPPPVDAGFGAPVAGATGAVGPASPVPLKYAAYGAEGGAPPGPEAAGGGLNSPELKYSCSLDFVRTLPSDRMGLVAHNHSYHLPPHAHLHAHAPAGGPSSSRLDKPDERSRDHVTRDEKRARAMSIPISTDDIVHLPMDEFNERLSKHDLTEPQLSLIRDIRRRGKNKLAAQNCRKRKLDQILSLAEEVRLARDQRQRTLSEHQRLSDERARIKDQYAQLYRHVFQALRDPDGRPYSPLEYSLQQSADGSVLLVPRAAAAGATVDPEASGARRKTRDPHRPD